MGHFVNWRKRVINLQINYWHAALFDRVPVTTLLSTGAEPEYAIAPSKPQNSAQAPEAQWKN